jgi:hypothetical protein
MRAHHLPHDAPYLEPFQALRHITPFFQSCNYISAQGGAGSSDGKGGIFPPLTSFLNMKINILDNNSPELFDTEKNIFSGKKTELSESHI